jgi:hypothetical protein
MTEIRDAIKLLLSGLGKLPDVFSISCKDMRHILAGYYSFAGRILSTGRDVFGKRTGKIGEKAISCRPEGAFFATEGPLAQHGRDASSLGSD